MMTNEQLAEVVARVRERSYPLGMKPSEVGEMQAIIAQLWDAREQLTEVLKVRSKQIGVACLKHDLTHSLACGRCYAQQDAIIQQQREVMRMAEKVILSATAFASQADMLEAKECIAALDAALEGGE